MEFNYNVARKKVYKLVKKSCDSPNNIFTAAWDYHILAVARHSLSLGRKTGADLKVLEIASLLHDYSSTLHPKYVAEHHVHSVKFAEKILKELNFPEKMIEHTKHCILSHRGSLKIKRATLESKILASADAMSHITELASMFYLTYGVRKFKTKEGAEWLKGKLQRSWNKIMPEGKEMVKNDYELAMKIINKALADSKN
jgi:uncharacterized protein